MATEIRDASGSLIGYQLEHTAQQIDDGISNGMAKQTYDPDNAVATAGGIVAYVSGLDGNEVGY